MILIIFLIKLLSMNKHLLYNSANSLKNTNFKIHILTHTLCLLYEDT